MFWRFWKREEIIRNKFLSKEYLNELLKKNMWYSQKQIDVVMDVLNKDGKLVLKITINRLVHEKEIYDYDDEDDIKLIKTKDKQFSKFTPYYNYISFNLDCYDEMTEFLYMLKNDGLRVFYAFDLNGDGMKELKHQL